jgi:hypothetical protein
MLEQLMADPIVSVLSKLALSRLMEMRNEAAEQITDLQQQLSWIDRAVVEKSGGKPAGAFVAPPSRPGRRKSSKREAILAVLGSREPGRAWVPGEVRDALNEQGIESNTAAVRVALRRMLEAGEVERGGPNDSGWKLPSDDEAAGEAPADDQRSANGYRPESAFASIDRPAVAAASTSLT